MPRIRVLFAALCVAGLPAHAWADDGPTPETVAYEYFQALQSDGLRRAPDFMHPDELNRFKELLLPLYEFEDQAGVSELRNATFGADASLENVQQSSGAQFMRAFLNVVTTQAEATGGIHFDKVEVLGSIREAPDTVHVVTRTSVAVGPLSIKEMEVLSFRPYQDGWKTLLTGQMEGLAAQLRSQLPAPPALP